jgi:hypothetical protein
MKVHYSIKYSTRSEIPTTVGIDVVVVRTCKIGSASSPHYIINSLSDIASVGATVAAWIAADTALVTAQFHQMELNQAMTDALVALLGTGLEFDVEVT